MTRKTQNEVWVEGKLRLLPATDLLRLLGKRRFTGRFAMISAGASKRVVALHLEDGEPSLAIGTGISQASPLPEQSFRARQLLLEALGWTMGSFRIDEIPIPERAQRQELGTLDDLLTAARRRSELWPGLVRRLPGPIQDLTVTRLNASALPSEPIQQAVLQALAGPTPLQEVAPRCAVDEDLVLKALLDLAGQDAISIGTFSDTSAVGSRQIDELLPPLLAALRGGDHQTATLKVVILAWDARTCFKTVNALLGRRTAVPDDVEQQPRYQILQEKGTLGSGMKLEVLGFRADTFQPAFAAPLVQDSHIFLLVTDLDAGQLRGTERPLVDRINELRDMFSGATVAGRITVGAGAVTDPGCDVVIPEIARYVSWEDLMKSDLLGSVLREVSNRLGLASHPDSAVTA